MRQSDDFNDHNGSLPVIYMAAGVSLFILLVMGIVIAGNKKPDRPPAAVTEKQSTEEEVSSASKLTADDLDIWDMYPEETVEEAVVDDKKKEEEKSSEEEPSTESIDESRFIYISYDDGSSERVPINPSLKKNSYEYTSLISHDGRPGYYMNGNQISSLGASISRYQKDVDFYQMKQDGIDFVMLRVGARGYKTGELQLDETFDENIKKATEAGLQVGLYVYSQAVTAEEAVAEAQLVLDHIGEYPVSYPVAIEMEFVPNDSSRVETLTRDERTAVTAAFINKIKEAGRTPMIYGNKEWLVKRIDLSKLNDCCVWLAEEDDFPHYPYEYAMWQYTTKGEVKGVKGYVDLSISFIDYSAR